MITDTQRGIVNTIEEGQGNEVQAITLGTSGVTRLSYSGEPATSDLTLGTRTARRRRCCKSHLNTHSAL